MMHYRSTSLTHFLHRGRLFAALLLLASLVATGCGTTIPTQEPVRLTLAASSSALPLAGDLARAYHTAFPHISVDVLSQANEAAATQAVLAGRADAALVAGPLPAADGLAADHVASDALAIVVHPDRALGNLTVQQIQEVFNGRLRTWQELGAGEGSIQVLLREPAAGPRQTLVEAFLGARQLTPTAILLSDDRQILARVAGDPESIAALPAGWLDQQVQAVEIDGRGPEWVARQWPGYPAELPIHLLTPNAPAPDVAALRQFLLGPRGQQLVSQRYAPAANQP